jgi:hypothetical protein
MRKIPMASALAGAADQESVNAAASRRLVVCDYLSPRLSYHGKFREVISALRIAGWGILALLAFALFELGQLWVQGALVP